MIWSFWITVVDVVAHFGERRKVGRRFSKKADDALDEVRAPHRFAHKVSPERLCRRGRAGHPRICPLITANELGAQLVAMSSA